MAALWRTQANRMHEVTVELCWRPAENGRSGDFHDVLDLPDGRVAVVLGETAGEGGHDLAEQLRFDVRRALRGGASAAAALAAADAELSGAAVSGRTATAVCLVIDAAARRADVSNAGHLPVLATTAGGARFLQEHIDRPLGWGGHRAAAPYPLEEDTSLYLFTNGLVDRPTRRRADGLLALLRCSRDLTGGAASATELARRATDRLGPPVSDAAVVSVRLRPAPHAGAPRPRTVTSAGTVLLRLYADPLDSRSVEAERVIREMASRLVPEVEVRLEVVDLAESTDLVGTEGPLGGPTLVRLEPPPLLRVVGGLHSARELAKTLRLPWEDGR